MKRDDGGRAMIEFVFLGILTLVPLIYLVIAVAQVERNVFGATQAAREAGRAYATADDPLSAEARAGYAAHLALADQGVDAPEVSPRYVPVSTPCSAGGTGAQSLDPGADFAVCVTRVVIVPGVPTFLAGHGIVVTGRYVVHVDDFRAGQGP